MKQFKTILLGLGLTLLFGCADDFEKLNSYYNSGDYILAGKAAIDGFKDRKDRPKIQTFLNKHGHKYVTRALKKGHRYTLTPESDQGLIYLNNLIQIFYTFQDLDITIPNLPEGITEANLLAEGLRREHVEIQYNLGIKALERFRYRKSITHFRSVTQYHPNYKDTEDKALDAELSAKRTLLLHQFFTPADPLSDLFSTGSRNVFTSSTRLNDSIKSAYIIEGVNIPNRFQHIFFRELTDKKSKHLTVLDYNKSDSKKGHYFLEAAIDVEITDLQNYPHRELRSSVATYTVEENGKVHSRSTHIDYEILKTSYEVAIAAKVSLKLAKTGKEVKQYQLEKKAYHEQRFKTEPLSLPQNAIQIYYPAEYQRLPEQPTLINTREILLQAIDLTVEELVKVLLEDIDKDMDPFTVEVELGE